MGAGGRYEPTFGVAVLVQIICFVLMIFLPIIWIAIILFGLITLLGSPSDAKSKASDTVKWMRTVTLIPYIFTVEHSRLLCGGRSKNNEDVRATCSDETRNSKLTLIPGRVQGSRPDR
jgi:hypothetical protein